MPYTPTAPTLVLCQALADAVAGAWAPVAPSAVGWDFFKRYADADELGAARLDGRQVVFFPADYEKAGATRAEDSYTHRVQCLVVERYGDGGGDPPRDWTAARVDFVHARIVQGLWFTRARPGFNPKLLTLSADVQVLDVERLTGGGRLFYSLTELVFEELIPQ